MESQPQNPEFRNNPENFHPCDTHWKYLIKCFQCMLKNTMVDKQSDKLKLCPVCLRMANRVKPDLMKPEDDPGPKVIKLFSCSTQLSMKFNLLMKTKMLKNEGLFLSSSQMLYTGCTSFRGINVSK